MRSASTPVVIASLAAMVGQAVAQPQPPFMPLGPAAPAPVGYLDFCAHSPDQCALKNEVDPLGQPIGVEERSHQLRAKYFWSVFFGSGQPSNIGLSPAAGASTRPTPAARSPGGRYDWSAIFDASGPSEGPPTVAPSEEVANDQAPPSAATRPLAASQSVRDQTVAVQPLQTNHALLAELDRVNLRVNAAIRYVPDRVLYGQEDYWHLPLDADGPAEGDCKDYVLEKRRVLIADGVPAADLSIAIVETTWGETHAVLLVTTDRGELVLDSLSSWVKPWQDVGYRWIERQAPGQQLSWVNLGQGQ
jgi:predicted transglutaminase-like cysteine proteinase